MDPPPQAINFVEMKTDDLLFVVNHIFLPKELPQKHDGSSNKQNIFVQHVLHSALAFHEQGSAQNSPSTEAWQIVIRMLNSFARLHQSDTLDSSLLDGLIDEMNVKDVIPIDVVKQNAAVILRRPENDLLTAEYFQASPRAEAVASNAGKLIIQFPHHPRSSMPFNADCIESTSCFLSTFSQFEMEDAIPKTSKAKSKNREYRDVADIRYISELFGGIVAGLTEDHEAIASTTQYVTKRVSDHVLWKSALLPWRRLPKWLILRVAIQTTLQEHGVDKNSPFGYKAFITFVHARALEIAVSSADFPLHVLAEMNVKIAIRMDKISKDGEVNEDLGAYRFIYNTVKDSRARLDAKWSAFQEKYEPVLGWTAPTDADIEAAKRFNLINSQEVLAEVIARPDILATTSSAFDAAPFEREQLARIFSRLRGHSPPRPLDLDCLDEDLWAGIVEVEKWVEDGNLTVGWFNQASSSHQREFLVPMILQFQKLAMRFKKENPERFSRLFLMMFELWIALDKSVVQEIPVLADYSPEFNIDAFDALVLPDASQMVRLAKIERYIRARLSSQHRHTSVFRLEKTRSCFSARYFESDQGSKHRQLQAQILAWAEKARTVKREEHARKSDQYCELVKAANGRCCEYCTETDNYGFEETYHSSSCTKCSLERQASGISIKIFEWPLPEDPVLSAIVLIELNTPLAFSQWRDVSWILLRNFSRDFSPATDSPKVILSKYSELQAFFSSPSAQKLTVASYDAKSHLVSHYATQEFPCSDQDVIKEHPLIYDMFDRSRVEWLKGSMKPSLSIRAFCTPSLPQEDSARKYANLGWALESTKHTSNTVIAQQSTCLEDLGVHEYMIIGHLRSGTQIQWHNMALALVTAGSLGDEAVYVFFRQAACQVETADASGCMERQAHWALNNADFGWEIFKAMKKRFESVQDNWTMAWTLTILSCLACRIVQVTEDDDVRASMLGFLACLRKTLCRFIDDVLQRIRQSDSTSHGQLRIRLVQLAATSHSTFQVGPFIGKVLDNAEDLFHFFYASLILASNIQGGPTSFTSGLRALLEADVILCAQVFPRIRDVLAHNPFPLDKAVVKIWGNYIRDDSEWRHVGNRWVSCLTSRRDGHVSRAVHFNLFNGTLRVDGKTLDMLPRDIVINPFYQSIFPNQNFVEISPSTMQGMDYSLRYRIGSTEVHFLQQQAGLVIRIRYDNLNTAEFIEPAAFIGDIPCNVLDTAIVLYHDTDGRVEFFSARPKGWKPSDVPDWVLNTKATMHLTRFAHVSHIQHGNQMLSPHSSTVVSLFSLVKSLEISPDQLLVFLSSKPHTALPHQKYFGRHLLIDLPRYNLSFYIDNSDSVASKEFPRFSIASLQTLGTLLGLQSKLVLESPGQHSIAVVPVIPDCVSTFWESSRIAPVVMVRPAVNCAHVRTCVLEIDLLVLKRVLPKDSTLSSWLYLALLHALTSAPLPDPLTAESGVQSAFRMLLNSRSISFKELDDTSLSILQLIAECSPIRHFYPPHRKVMETITWNRKNHILPPFIRDDRWEVVVHRIFDHAANLAIFRPDSSPLKQDFLDQSDTTLVKRALYRFSRSIPVDDISDALIIDSEYTIRPVFFKPRAELASLTREIIAWRSTTTSPTADLWQLYRKWGTFSSRPIPHPTVMFNSLWVLENGPSVWFTYLDLCLQGSINGGDRLKLAFTLPAIAFRSPFSLPLVRTLLLISIHAESDLVASSLRIIPRVSFNMSHSPELTREIVQGWAESAMSSMKSWQHGFVRAYKETNQIYASRVQCAYSVLYSQEVKSGVDFVWSQWRRRELQKSRYPSHLKLLRPSFIDFAISQFSSRFCNGVLRTHAQTLQSIVERYSYSQPLQLDLPLVSPRLSLQQGKFVPADLQSVMRARRSNAEVSFQVSYTRDVVSMLRQSGQNTLEAYLDDLDKSIDASERSSLSISEQVPLSLQPNAFSQRLMNFSCIWPSTNPLQLLRYLAFDRRSHTAPLWREQLTIYARSLINHQRSLRLSRLSQLDQKSELDKEQLSVPPEEIDDVDWLLIQLECDFSIRSNQVAVAQRMMHPVDDKSLVTQLNMGEGKTSVIMPIISASLADGKALVHVVVLKPLVDQSFHILKHTVSGIVNRPVFFLPFSRDVSLSDKNTGRIISLFRQCQQAGGVLLAQPEHILSLRLRTTEQFCMNGPTSSLAKELLDFQTWLHEVSRLLLDESDELLKVKYQLIYTIGTPSNLTGQPRRSEIIQDVLSKLGDIASRVVENQFGPVALELRSSEKYVGGFPPLRILERSSDVVKVLFEEVITSILSALSFRNFNADDDAALRQYVTTRDVQLSVETRLKLLCGSTFDTIIILRGLFAHGLLEHVFSDKRHRVDYGLHPSRTMLAVPYRSKDQPASRAEFGHPDIILILTLLSYYYTGLTNTQLDVAFDLLLRSDNPGMRYEAWIQPTKHLLSPGLRSLHGLNLEDVNQKINRLFPYLRFNKAVVDFYASQVVFPKAREFPSKLTTSAWDLVQRSARPTTGFSGTKDNRWHLPTTIRQDDSPDQQATSAIQLKHLLKPENDKVITTDNDSAEFLLRRLIALGNVTILLDVGAQILELDNTELAELWLQLDPRPCYEAVVYFDPQSDEPFVLHRDGRVERFQESLYRTQLDKCLVYLDEAHTRGTDFKFPPEAVAVVTLGPRLTKDKLVQGCMRLRQLAARQSVILFCPSEVESKVRQSCNRLSGDLTIQDVVKWTILQTMDELEVGMPLWRQQGTNFVSRQATWRGFSEGTIDAQTAAAILREPEAQSLETLYGVAQEQMSSTGPISDPDRLLIIERCQMFGISTSAGSGSLLEEQERELAHEKETEREIQRAGLATALPHSLDSALFFFIKTGSVSTSWLTLAECMQSTSCRQHIPSGLWTSQRLLGTKDFRDTIQVNVLVKASAKKKSKVKSANSCTEKDDFIRPVHWILSSINCTTLVLISSYEANELLPVVRESSTAFLHLYSARDSRNVRTLEDLDFITIPRPRSDDARVFLERDTIPELNLFAGQLFFRSKESFDEACRMLGLWLGSIPDEYKGKIDADGFVADDNAKKILGLDDCRLTESPVVALQKLVAMRRKGQGFMLTHVGKMIFGQDLDEKEFIV